MIIVRIDIIVVTFTRWRAQLWRSRFSTCFFHRSS